jgi:tetratricopeptide (TPR) repeat protein
MGFSGDAPRIEKGLAQYESDYYAVLGVPVTANAKDIRKGYLNVAKSLHPDRFVGRPDEADRANWLFSKLISPANEVMNKDKERTEYEAILQLRIRRLLEKPSVELWPNSEVVRKLRNSKTWEADYLDAVQQLAAGQYQELSEVLARTEQLSELNLAYLLLKAGMGSPDTQPRTTPSPPPIPIATPSSASAVAAPAPAPSPSQTRFMQALDMIERRQYKEAIQYLGYAIAAEPNQANYYAYRGSAYQKMGNAGMAKADFLQALRLDPDNDEAKRGMKVLAGPGGGTSTPQPIAQQAKGQPQKGQPQKGKSDNGGSFFGKLFGGGDKKK